jgi:type IV secretory pathway component VirB8
MVNRAQEEKNAKPNRATRIIYSALGLSVIGAVVAVLGAPVKWN